jgi:endonuclease-3
MSSPDFCFIYHYLCDTYDLSQSGDEFLHFNNPFEVLVATILSAQTTDRCVNQVTKVLFARYPDADSLAKADHTEVEEIIHSTGFYRAKTRNIIAAAQTLMDTFDGSVPEDMSHLLTIPGVGRKTANIVIHHAFGRSEGIAVDTHVRRVSTRLGLSNHSDPDKIEQDLLALIPPDLWGEMNGLFILHGRHICHARRPACTQCGLISHCKYAKTNPDLPSHR